MQTIILALLPLLTISTESAAPTSRSATTTAIAHRDPSSGILSDSDLIAIARLKARVSNDQFSDDATLAYIGRDFAIQVDPDLMTVDYNRDNQTLRVSFQTYFDELILAKDVKSSSYTGQNAFGAKAVISKERGNTFGIRLPGDITTRKLISYVTSLNGPQARELSKALRLRLSGKVVRANYVNTAVLEIPDTSQATVASPTDKLVNQYLVCVALSKAEWIDSRTGTVLATETTFVTRRPFRPLCAP